MSEPGTTLIEIDHATKITVWADPARGLVFFEIDAPGYDDVVVIGATPDKADEPFRAIASAGAVVSRARPT
jgi:hypothetical protein